MDIEATERGLRKEKLFAFLLGEMARKDHRQCVEVALFHAPGQHFNHEQIRAWSREQDPKVFEDFCAVEPLVDEILQLAEDETTRKKPGRYRFFVRTSQYLGGKPTHSFALYHSPIDHEPPVIRSQHMRNDHQDARKCLLVRVAGDIASGLVQRSALPGAPKTVAKVSIDIAEAILKKAGL